MMLTHSQIKSLIIALQNDEIVIMPTDTIYGFSAKNSESNRIKINQLKKAQPEKLLITLISNYEQLSKFVEYNEYSQFTTLLNQGVTLIFSNRNVRGKTIAIRLIKRPDLVKIINQVGPLWTTSVNLHCHETIHDLAEIKVNFPNLKIFNDSKFTKKAPSKIYDTLNNKWLR